MNAPPDEAWERGEVEGEADLFERSFADWGEDVCVGFELGAVGGALRGEKCVQTGGGVGGGFEVDDPEEVFAGGVRFGASTETAVDSD